MADEVRQAKHDGEAIVEYVRSLGVQVPQAVIDRAPVLISNYLLSENTTQRLLDLADALPNRRSGENATLWNKVKDTWRLAISGNMTLHELLPSNSTEALGAVGQSIAAEAKGIGVALLNFLLGVLNFFLSAFFELSLFYWTLKFLGRQHRTVMHVIAHRVLGWVVPAEEATKVADKTEKQLLDIFDKLSQSYVHLIMFNFCATFFTFSVCDIEYPITSALISVFLAVLPLGVTVTAPALMLAVPRLIYLKHYECLASFAGITVLLQVYRGMIRFFEVTSDEEGIGHTSVLTLSVVLGYVSFGVKGVVIGPIILLTCRQLWRACNAPRAWRSPLRSSQTTCSAARAIEHRATLRRESCTLKMSSNNAFPHQQVGCRVTPGDGTIPDGVEPRVRSAARGAGRPPSHDGERPVRGQVRRPQPVDQHLPAARAELHGGVPAQVRAGEPHREHQHAEVHHERGAGAEGGEETEMIFRSTRPARYRTEIPE
jgi:predicted PurR-regulated permease PerM